MRTIHAFALAGGMIVAAALVGPHSGAQPGYGVVPSGGWYGRPSAGCPPGTTQSAISIGGSHTHSFYDSFSVSHSHSFSGTSSLHRHSDTHTHNLAHTHAGLSHTHSNRSHDHAGGPHNHYPGTHWHGINHTHPTAPGLPTPGQSSHHVEITARTGSARPNTFRTGSSSVTPPERSAERRAAAAPAEASPYAACHSWPRIT